MAVVYFYYVDSMGNLSLLGTQLLSNCTAPSPGQIIAYQQAPPTWDLAVFRAATSAVRGTPEEIIDTPPINHPSTAFSPPPVRAVSSLHSSAPDEIHATPSELNLGTLLAKTIWQISLSGLAQKQPSLNPEGPVDNFDCHLPQEKKNLRKFMKFKKPRKAITIKSE